MEALIARKPEVFRQKQNIDARVRHEVEAIDLDGRRVRVHALEEDKVWWEPFDQLVIGTGAVATVPDVPGADARGIYKIRSLQDGIRVRKALDGEEHRRAVVVGGGYIGLEMTEALVGRGLEVSLVMPRVMKTLDDDMGALLADTLEAAGVDTYLEERLETFEVDGGRVTGIVTGKRTLPADLVILGAGVRPNSALAREAGIPLGEKGAIRVNERMQTGIEGVWAAGDCVETFHLVSRRPFYISLATVANKQGRVAGMNIGGEYATFPGVVGTAVTRVFDLEVARTGLQENEIEELGWEYVTTRIEGRTRAHYFPGTAPITVKLLAERGSGRLLGGQIVGGLGSAKRIDIVAVSLHAGLTVEEMIHLDLGYAPPFSPTWDPVLIAVRQILKKV